MSPTAAIEKITAWSYSRWQTYAKCPLMAKFKIIDKRKEPKAEAMVRGSEVHDIAESYVTSGYGKKLQGPRRLPKELKLFKEEFKELRKKSCDVEAQYAFTKGWKKTSWFGDDAWFRVVCDVVYLLGDEAIIIDFKTGKVRDENRKQLELYAIALFLLIPVTKVVRAQFWYLDAGVLTEELFERKDLPALKRKWKDETRVMLSDTIFAPRPGFHCKWCHWRKENGGPCEY